ncbi:MAG: hypothetical protein ACO2ZM_06170, partial [Francisellaceae bacterium]
SMTLCIKYQLFFESATEPKQEPPQIYLIRRHIRKIMMTLALYTPARIFPLQIQMLKALNLMKNY